MRIDTQSPVVQIGAISLAFAGGSVVSWFFTKRKYERQVEQEITEAREFYENKYSKNEDFFDAMKYISDSLSEDLVPVKPEVAEADDLVVELGYSAADRPKVQKTSYNKPVKETPKMVAVETVVVAAVPDGIEERPEWDYELEISRRQHEVPYIIHRDEFENALVTGHTQLAYEYYGEDNVLVDEAGDVSTNMYQLIGVDTLQFGHGSGDPTVVFVRNEVLGLDFEINLIDKSYSQEVLGLEPENELRHSEYRGRRRRDFDD